MNVILLTLSVLLKVWCLTKMWAWFVVPLGVPAVGMAPMLGLIVAYNLVKHSCDDDNLCDIAVDCAAYSLATLLIGYLLTLAL